MASKRRRGIPFKGPNTTKVTRYKRTKANANVPSDTYNWTDNTSVWASLSGTQETVSENHPSWKSARKTGSFAGDAGGDFTTEKRYVSFPDELQGQTMSTPWRDSGAGYEVMDRWNGPVLPSPPGWLVFPPSARSSEGGLAALGTTAIARCSPTNSVASLATSLSELYHEGIPAMLGSPIWERRARNVRDVYKTAGNEYLKAEFGWKPLVSDITSIANVIVNSDRLIKQVRRDSNRMVRRRYNFPPVHTVSTTELRSNISPSKLGGWDNSFYYRSVGLNQGKLIRIDETTINRWFSGSFTYHLPEYESGLMNQFTEADRLLGLSLDPEVLWNITPWSWAVDWFSNVGDVIHNVNAMSKYGLVLRYGYIMEHSIRSYTYAYVGPDVYLTPCFPTVFSLVTETKLRRRATPFGFGLTWGGLSTTQKAIAAALGLSRA